jgi:radical SAM/Cys-rich protein
MFMKTPHDLLVSDGTTFPPIKRHTLDVLQVNLGYLCNLSCVHCHVNAGPTRKELMSEDNLDMVINVLKKHNIKTLDLTGGAPEMNPGFKDLVIRARELGVHVIDRCNLTILEEEGYEWLAEFLADYSVEIVASLPCYTEDNVDKQRGKGVFTRSIDAIKKLNKLGYGQDDSSLTLNLVYNPSGPFLPPSQNELLRDYTRVFSDEYNIVFNDLFTITNMPINRFGAVLLAQGQFDDYMTLLKENYSSENLKSVMCTSMVSVDWNGWLYDCDFNQMLDMPTKLLNSQRAHLKDLISENIVDRSIYVADHCFGCTAGQGSSCGGALE